MGFSSKGGNVNMKIKQSIILITTLFVFIYSCNNDESETSKKETSAAVVDEEVSELVITGKLSIEQSTASSDTLLENQKVDLEDSKGNIVASGYSDKSGEYSIQAGSLAIPAAQLQLNASDYTISSLIEDNGDGKVLGIRQSITINSATVVDGGFNVGESIFKEVAAIKGTIKFVSPDGSENTNISKISTDVFLPGYSFFAKTDADGKFLILYIPAGTYNIRVEKLTYVYQSSVTVEESTTLDLGTISIQTDTTAPITTASKSSTDFKNPLCVTLSSDDTTGTIYYTTDGSNPTATTTFKYDSSTTSTCGSTSNCPLCFTKSTTLKYFAVDTVGNEEEIKSHFYYYNEKWLDPSDTTAPTVTLSIDSGDCSEHTALSDTHVCTSTAEISLSTNEGGDIYYTLDGTSPTSSSTQYSSPITLLTTKTIKFFAKDWALNNSTTSTKTLEIHDWSETSLSVGNCTSLPIVNQLSSAVALDEVNNKLVIFINTTTDETYEIDLSTSTCTRYSQNLPSSPSFISKTDNGRLVRMFYDSVASRLILFSLDNSSPSNPLIYYYSGSGSWTAYTQVSQPSISNAAPGDGAINGYLFKEGSTTKALSLIQSNVGSKHSYTITFSGTTATWSNINATDIDTYYGDFGFTSGAFDSTNNKVYIFGMKDSDYIPKMFSFTPSSSSWSEVSYTGTLPPHYAGCMTYDPYLKRIIYFGGSESTTSSSNYGTGSDESYSFNVSTNKWTKLNITSSPPHSCPCSSDS